MNPHGSAQRLSAAPPGVFPLVEGHNFEVRSIAMPPAVGIEKTAVRNLLKGRQNSGHGYSCTPSNEYIG